MIESQVIHQSSVMCCLIIKLENFKYKKIERGKIKHLSNKINYALISWARITNRLNNYKANLDEPMLNGDTVDANFLLNDNLFLGTDSRYSFSSSSL